MPSTLATKPAVDYIEIEAINMALEIIDKTLGAMHTRELVSTSEVTNLLLDLRSILTAGSTPLDDTALGVPHEPRYDDVRT
jgi:hypothetical protein